MATLTIRKVDEAVKAQLRVQAALNGRSMEEEARSILRRALVTGEPEQALGQCLLRRFEGLVRTNEGVPLRPRTMPRATPDLGDVE